MRQYGLGDRSSVNRVPTDENRNHSVFMTYTSIRTVYWVSRIDPEAPDTSLTTWLQKRFPSKLPKMSFGTGIVFEVDRLSATQPVSRDHLEIPLWKALLFVEIKTRPSSNWSSYRCVSMSILYSWNSVGTVNFTKSFIMCYATVLLNVFHVALTVMSCFHWPYCRQCRPSQTGHHWPTHLRPAKWVSVGIGGFLPGLTPTDVAVSCNRFHLKTHLICWMTLVCDSWNGHCHSKTPTFVLPALK